MNWYIVNSNWIMNNNEFNFSERMEASSKVEAIRQHLSNVVEARGWTDEDAIEIIAVHEMSKSRYRKIYCMLNETTTFQM